MKYLLKGLRTSILKWKYLLNDGKYAVKPVFGIYLLVALSMGFVFFISPGIVITLLCVLAIYLIFKSIRRAAKSLSYSRLSRQSQKDENLLINYMVSDQVLVNAPPDAEV